MGKTLVSRVDQGRDFLCNGENWGIIGFAITICLDAAHENRYRHRHIWERDEIIEFRIQYEALIAGNWHPIVRYDSAHGKPHKDTLYLDATQTKEMYPGYSNAEVLTIGQRDIMENWPRYRARYEKEMGK